METKEEIFNKTQDNFKKICTANGIDKDALSEFIVNAIELIPEENKLDFLDYLVVEIIMCSNNIHEALGVLSLSKAKYLDIMEIKDFDDEDDD
jgi:hypothetical protein